MHNVPMRHNTTRHATSCQSPHVRSGTHDVAAAKIFVRQRLVTESILQRDRSDTGILPATPAAAGAAKTVASVSVSTVVAIAIAQVAKVAEPSSLTPITAVGPIGTVSIVMITTTHAFDATSRTGQRVV